MSMLHPTTFFSNFKTCLLCHTSQTHSIDNVFTPTGVMDVMFCVCVCVCVCVCLRVSRNLAAGLCIKFQLIITQIHCSMLTRQSIVFQLQLLCIRSILREREREERGRKGRGERWGETHLASVDSLLPPAPREDLDP